MQNDHDFMKFLIYFLELETVAIFIYLAIRFY